MKKIFFTAIAFLMMVSTVWATGACVPSATETVNVNGERVWKYIDFTCTSDGSGIAAYTFSPTTFGVKGWLLYNITTDPDGTSAPTNSYDITCMATGEDVCGGLLADRSSTLRQTVCIAPTILNYHAADGAIAFTFANITSNPGIFVMRLRFTSKI